MDMIDVWGWYWIGIIVSSCFTLWVPKLTSTFVSLISGGWSLGIIAQMLVHTVTEGSTIATWLLPERMPNMKGIFGSVELLVEWMPCLVKIFQPLSDAVGENFQWLIHLRVKSVAFGRNVSVQHLIRYEFNDSCFIVLLPRHAVRTMYNYVYVLFLLSFYPVV